MVYDHMNSLCVANKSNMRSMFCLSCLVKHMIKSNAFQSTTKTYTDVNLFISSLSAPRTVLVSTINVVLFHLLVSLFPLIMANIHTIFLYCHLPGEGEGRGRGGYKDCFEDPDLNLVSVCSVNS